MAGAVRRAGVTGAGRVELPDLELDDVVRVRQPAVLRHPARPVDDFPRSGPLFAGFFRGAPARPRAVDDVIGGQGVERPLGVEIRGGARMRR
jgi:hypothetical protein